MCRRSACRLIAMVLLCGAAFMLYNALPFSHPHSLQPLEIRPAIVSIDKARKSHNRISSNNIEKIVLSLVSCDERFNESLNVIKSVLLFTRTPVYFVIFADDNLLPQFNTQLSQWRTLRNGTFNFELQRIKFPEKHQKDWMNLFNKCAAQRLFMPSLASHIDSLIYVDTDTLLLGPADELWGLFRKFSSEHMSALALEDENPNVSWYPRFAKHPFYGKVGLNSGVMLMNLTRMRNFKWVDYITPIMLRYKLYIPWGDQDIINIIFHHHGDSVLELSCRYNYRTDQCMYGDGCRAASQQGALVLHGSRRAFRAHKQPAFQAIYRAVDEYELGTDPRYTLLPNMQQYFDEAPLSNCGSLRDVFLKLPIHTTHTLYGKPDR